LGLKALAFGTEGLLIMRRFSFSVVGVIAVLAIAMQSSASGYLTQVELFASRGGGAQAKDCTYSCNAANGYINLCPVANNADCTVCNNGANIVHYTDMAGDSCSQNGGFTSSPTRTQDCGVQQSGRCSAVGACTKLSTTKNNCTDPRVICPQGNCP
jgi:hypothetical protein